MTDPRPQLQIAKPCHEDWARMTPNEQGRHCASCDKTVVDVTRMRPAEGRRFLGKLRDDLAAGAHVCVRSHADAAGRLLAPSATRRLLTNGLAAVLAVAMAGCQGSGPAVAQPAVGQPTTQQAVQPQPAQQQPAQQPVECIQGDVAVMQPVQGGVAAVPEPPRELVGRVAQPVQPEPPKPQPQPMMGAPVAVPVIKGEIEAVPAPVPRETMGKVAAPRDG